jgi:hypothetical protein
LSEGPSERQKDPAIDQVFLASNFDFMVEVRGLEPLAYAMRTRRSPI